MPVSEIDRHLGQRISEARETRGLSQQVMAEEISIELATLAKMELGDLRVSALVLARVARVLETPLSWFYAGLPGQDVIDSKLGSQRLV